MDVEVRFMKGKLQAAVVLLSLLACCGSQAATNALLGWSETGLHETDGRDVSVYELAPPYSTIHAQFITGGLLVTNPSRITVTYQAVADATGSINTTSRGKGNFYQYVQALFGVALAPDQGLAGYGMPGTNNLPQPMTFDSTQNCFSAVGIPITPYDDRGQKNDYPMMRLTARDNANNVLATTDIVLPVSDEMQCASCHASGSQTAARPPEGWVWDVDPVRDYKLNVLRSHDDHYLGSAFYTAVLAQVGYNPAGLLASAKDGHPVLCIKCHSSNALPGPVIPNVLPLTEIMHTKHAYISDPVSGQTLASMTNSAACVLCHSAPENRRVRGVHHNPVNPDGTLALQCQSCHGSITAVGASGRQGWLDEPNCQSCHTGTATSNSGALRFTSAFGTNGLPRQPADLTFATQTNTPAAGLSLYRFSQEHGGLKCAACHGPSHAEVVSSQPNDNVQTANLQTPAGAGVMTDCAACHTNRPAQLLGGPHGMHPVDAQWAAGHDQNNRAQCQVCHGIDYRGTVLSWAQGNRTYFGDANMSFWHGFQVGCYTCHNGPNGGDTGTGNPNVAATAISLTASTMAEQPVTITLVASGPAGVALTYRVVSPPAHGTVSVNGNVATYFPNPGFVGSDSFTYSAWDGTADSNLGTVTVTAVAGPCYLTVSTLIPTAAFPKSTVPFRANATLSQCSGTITYDWNFGDGSAHASGTNVSHIYTNAADYTWKLQVAANGTNQTVTGVVTISPTLGPPLTLSIIPQLWTMGLSWPVDSIPTTLETTGDWTQPYAWQPDNDPVYSDGTNNNVQVFVLPGPQYFRLRRVP